MIFLWISIIVTFIGGLALFVWGIIRESAISKRKFAQVYYRAMDIKEAPSESSTSKNSPRD